MEGIQEYGLEQLLPIAARLAVKYTSGESSSVTNETARMLMQTVIYCIRESFGEETGHPLPQTPPEAELLYRRGYELVLAKVMKAKAIFESIAEEFEDYGCRNYRDTVIKGIPGFFKRYDARFDACNHILTLDYPVLSGSHDRCGADLIYDYLACISREKQFLGYFGRAEVAALLNRLMPDYRSCYLDNICSPVLACAIGCVIAEKPVDKLLLEKEDGSELLFYFRGDTTERIEWKVRKLTAMVLGHMPKVEQADYFACISRELAVRIRNAQENGGIEGVFCLKVSE